MTTEEERELILKRKLELYASRAKELREELRTLRAKKKGKGKGKGKRA